VVGIEMDRIERAARTVESRIKKMSDGGEVEMEYKGLLSRMAKKQDDKKMDDIDRVAEYVKQIREAKEAVLNGK